MGLDMYLYAEKRIDQYDFIDDPNGGMERRDNLEFDKANELVKGMPTAEYGDITITKSVAYWRKANAVHGWIIRNCADGVDECQRIDMDRDDLIALREACLIGLKDRDNATPNSREDFRYIDGSKIDGAEAVTSIIREIKRESQRKNKNIVVSASDPIPPVSGFFFGSTDKDEYYYHQLAETVETINSILASDPNDTYSYYYRSSW